jgi:hypothetical protein
MISNQIEAVTQLLTEQPTFLYGSINELSGTTSTDISRPNRKTNQLAYLQLISINSSLK